MDEYWADQFKGRMAHFATRCPPHKGETAISVKLRLMSGCFECDYPEANALVKEQAHMGCGRRIMVEGHESGPELLAYVVLGAGLAKALIGLTTAFLNARVQSRQRCGRSTSPVKVIVRTIRQDGTSREEEAIEVDCTDPVTVIEIEEALTSATRKVLGGQVQEALTSATRKVLGGQVQAVDQKSARKASPRRRLPKASKPHTRKDA